VISFSLNCKFPFFGRHDWEYVESECILSTWILLVWHFFWKKIFGVTACDSTISSSPVSTKTLPSLLQLTYLIFNDFLKKYWRIVNEWSIFKIVTVYYNIDNLIFLLRDIFSSDPKYMPLVRVWFWWFMTTWSLRLTLLF
jgi:hypothetical protein